MFKTVLWGEPGIHLHAGRAGRIHVSQLESVASCMHSCRFSENLPTWSAENFQEKAKEEVYAGVCVSRVCVSLLVSKATQRMQENLNALNPVLARRVTRAQTQTLAFASFAVMQSAELEGEIKKMQQKVTGCRLYQQATALRLH